MYYCTNCDAQYLKWQGQCSECGKWGTVKSLEAGAIEESSTVIAKDSEPLKRLFLNMREIDTVLGGGLVPGSFLLLAGDPGIGKSTLVLQMADGLLRGNAGHILYVCGEESPAQIGLRLGRLRLASDRIKFLAAAETKSVRAAVIKEKPLAVIIDSIQTVRHSEADGEPGGVTQIRAAAADFLDLAKKNNLAIIVIGHVTKEGTVAGPRLLEHMVDTVLYLEGDKYRGHRILRSVKNRFGPTNQVGVFNMEEGGLLEVKNPSELFLSNSPAALPGSVVSVIMEGNRPFLVEIQALTNKTSFGYPKRATSGFDSARLELLLAVLARRAGLKLDNQDVFLNIVGGLSVKDPALDLAASLAVASSLANLPLPKQSVVLGEVGLGGEIRPVANLKDRLAEAGRLGFTGHYIPEQKGASGNAIKTIHEGLRVLGIEK